MTDIGGKILSADWKSEKHVPVIECPDRVAADRYFDIRASVGKEIDHPNTVEHHIRWIKLYFHPAGGKNTYQVAHMEFSPHGESVDGPNTGPVHTHHSAVATIRTTVGGVVHALAYCNIHGLWESSKEIAVDDGSLA